MEALTGPNSATSRDTAARNRPSEVPPLVESAGVTPVTDATAALSASVSLPRGRARQRPRQGVIDLVGVEDVVHPRFQIVLPGCSGISEVEPQVFRSLAR